MSDHPTERLATLTHAEPATQATGFTVPKKLAYAVLAVGAAALLVSGLLWQKLANIQVGNYSHNQA